MKNLELTQMEEVHGGNNCSNTTKVVNGVGLTGVVVSSLLVASTGGLALFAIGAATALYSIANCQGEM